MQEEIYLLTNNKFETIDNYYDEAEAMITAKAFTSQTKENHYVFKCIYGVNVSDMPIEVISYK